LATWFHDGRVLTVDNLHNYRRNIGVSAFSHVETVTKGDRVGDMALTTISAMTAVLALEALSEARFVSK